MKLKLNQIQILYSALAALDGHQIAVEAANGQKAVVLHHYEFPASVTWNKAKDLGILRRALRYLEGEQKKLFEKHAAGTEHVPEANRAAYIKELTALLDVEDDFDGVLKFIQADFNLFDPASNPKGNKIPSTILDALEPLIA